MNPPKKAVTRQQSQQEEQVQHSEASAGREFASVDEMLRHDALHTPVPPAIARRLEESLQHSPPTPPRPWWRRLLGGSSL